MYACPAYIPSRNSDEQDRLYSKKSVIELRRRMLITRAIFWLAKGIIIREIRGELSHTSLS